jgi:small-conductance mechanosensitive channel
VPITLGVHYASDLALVERLACEVGRQIMNTVPGGVPEFEPAVRFSGFGDSDIKCSVMLRARELADTFLVKHEFIKALVPIFRRSGVTIPFPVRALNLEQEKTHTLELSAPPTSATGHRV